MSLSLIEEIKAELLRIGIDNISGHKPIIIIVNGEEYKVSRGNEHGCCIEFEEMNDGINKISLSGDGSYFFVLTPIYYTQKINNWEKFDWIGEYKSKLHGRKKLISFGFGRYGSPLQKICF